MAATDFDITAFVLPTNGRSNQQASPISSRLSYSAHVNSGLETLSQKNPNGYDAIQGLLYAPTLSNTDPCSSEALDLFPQNVTRLEDMPSVDYPLMSIFPWTSAACTQAFLSVSRTDAVRGALVFQPTSGPNVPDSNSASWSLQDGGQWRSDNQFPVYAVSSQMATQILGALAQYSGDNLTDAPFGSQLTHLYDSSSVVRLLLKVDLVGSTVPSLWTFLIIVLAVLLGLVILASIVMHIVQRHQRHALQRRLARGEVDLESLGIKKMNVPQEQIDRMPSFLYKAKQEKDANSPATNELASASTTKTKVQNQARDTLFSQNTCAICLDDFVNNETMIRELPCKHIFHPDCIDPFLRDNSSLCPLCKKSALPAGYCPVRVTNIMVRRERLVRRMRERRRRNMAALTGTPLPLSRKEKVILFFKKLLRVSDGIPRADAPADHRRTWQRGNIDVEMMNNNVVFVGPAAATDAQPDAPARRETELPDNIARQGTAARRAWRRERLARQQEQNYTQQEEAARRADEGRPGWRRAMDRVFPGAG